MLSRDKRHRSAENPSRFYLLVRDIHTERRTQSFMYYIWRKHHWMCVNMAIDMFSLIRSLTLRSLNSFKFNVPFVHMLVVDDVGIVVGAVYVIHSFPLYLSINLSIDLFCIAYAVAFANFFSFRLEHTYIYWVALLFQFVHRFSQKKTPTCQKQRFRRFLCDRREHSNECRHRRCSSLL